MKKRKKKKIKKADRNKIIIGTYLWLFSPLSYFYVKNVARFLSLPHNYFNFTLPDSALV